LPGLVGAAAAVGIAAVGIAAVGIAAAGRVASVAVAAPPFAFAYPSVPSALASVDTASEFGPTVVAAAVETLASALPAASPHAAVAAAVAVASDSHNSRSPDVAAAHSSHQEEYSASDS